MPAIETTEFSMRRFKEGAVALVTGAAGGIGQAIVQRLVAEGVSVAATDCDTDALKSLVGQLPAGHDVHVVVGDVVDHDFRKELVTGTVEAFGRLDVLINNAGIMSGGAPESISAEDWDRVFAVNVTAPFFLAQEAIPHLAAARGAIVNQSSILGLRAAPALSPYTASKAAVVGLTMALAVDLAEKGVRVNALCPGTIDTPMPWSHAASVLGPDNVEAARDAFAARQLIKRLGTPDEVAAAAVFLASDDASFITGVALPVDGGWSAW
jgi:meso-butanediol dehydrogenase / (S,S)-butanediol dehydrogenase / diacetyl reductase